MTSQKSISSLYVLKAIAALWVVILHAPLGEATEYVRWISLAAVPVFFAITGYFLYSGDSAKMLDHLVGTIKKLIPMMLILHVIYYAISPIKGSLSEQYMLYFKWLVLGMPPLGGHLWYLTALLQACIILWVWIKLFKGRGLWLFLLLWLARAASEEYRMLIFGSEPSILSANVFFFALPCIALGMLLRKHEARLALPRWGGYACVGVMVLSYVFKFVVPQWIDPIYYVTINRTMMILAILLLAIHCKDFGAGSITERIGRDLSGNIYYFHGLFIYMLEGIWGYEQYGAIYIFVLSLAFAYLVVSLQRRLGIRVLR